MSLRQRWSRCAVVAVGLVLIGLPARGQVVTTGTCIVPLPIEPGDRIHADFGVLGSVSARMGADRPAG